MKLKGVLLALCVSTVLVLSAQAHSRSVAVGRRLVGDDLDDGLSDIKPYVKSTALTAANATKRLRSVTHQIKKLQHNLLSSLYRIKDYIVYHRMSSLKEYEANRELSRQSQAASESLLQDSVSPFSDKLPNQALGDDKLPMQNSEVDLPEAKTEAKETTAQKKRIRELWQVPRATFDGVDQPLLHGYGGIGLEQASFHELIPPSIASTDLAATSSPQNLPHNH